MRSFAAAAMESYAVETVTMLYSVSLSMSSFFQNNLLLRKACNSTVPFGECVVGEASAQLVVTGIYSWKASIQYTIPVVLIALAGESPSSTSKWCRANPTTDCRARSPVIIYRVAIGTRK